MKEIKFWCYTRAILAVLAVFSISGCMLWLAFLLHLSYDIFASADTVTFELMFFAVLAHSMAMLQYDYIFPAIEEKYLGKFVVHSVRIIFSILGIGIFCLFFKENLLFLMTDFELMKLFTIIFGSLLFISFVYHVYGDD